MTNATVPAVQCGVEIVVPLNKLKKSPRNARRIPHTAADIEQLAASIVAKGVLQPPVVEPECDPDGKATGGYLVTIGEGRRQALLSLARQKRISKTAQVRCLLDEGNDAFEISLDENVTRFAMHPADQFEAFHSLAEQQGRSAEEIAVRFGVSAQTVRQRLRLAVVSPKLMDAYRSGNLTLEQLMAFAVSEDHARQQQVFESLSYNRSPAVIRRLMTEHEVEATDARALFVGVDAYSGAGGRIRRDLFAEDRGGWFEDVGLLEQLAIAKLDGIAQQVCQEEGWRWAEAHLTYPCDHGLHRLYPRAVEPDPEHQAMLLALADEYDGIVADAGEGGIPAGADLRLREIDAILEGASLPVYAAEDYGRAGLFAILQHDGSVRIERGFVRPGDQPAPQREAGEPAAMTPSVGAPVKAKELSERLLLDLSAHRTAALRDLLASRPEDALLAALHALVLKVFYLTGNGTCLDLRASSSDLQGFADGYRQSVAGERIEARHEGWAIRLPERSEALWVALTELVPTERMALFAHCVSLTVDAVGVIGPRQSMAHADLLAEHLRLDMRLYWRATAESYFGRVSKAHILDTVTEACSGLEARKLEGMKKDAMAKAAADLLGAEGWLPPLLRDAAVPPA